MSAQQKDVKAVMGCCVTADTAGKVLRPFLHSVSLSVKTAVLLQAANSITDFIPIQPSYRNQQMQGYAILGIIFF